MSLTIELSPDQEQQIQQEAERVGVSVNEVVKRTIEARFPVSSGAANGDSNHKTLEMFAQWEREDASATDEERAEEERLFEQLHANMNETRLSLGMREI